MNLLNGGTYCGDALLVVTRTVRLYFVANEEGTRKTLPDIPTAL
jgi:hypothetical protein